MLPPADCCGLRSASDSASPSPSNPRFPEGKGGGALSYSGSFLGKVPTDDIGWLLPPMTLARFRFRRRKLAVKIQRGAGPCWRPAPLALESRWLVRFRPACDGPIRRGRRRRGPRWVTRHAESREGRAATDSCRRDGLPGGRRPHWLSCREDRPRSGCGHSGPCRSTSPRSGCGGLSENSC